MKIGTFAQKFHITTDTVRYYIDLGLLQPERKNKQYYFYDDCIQDMHFIMESKSNFFTLEEINKILFFKRTGSHNTALYYYNMLVNKENELIGRAQSINGAITKIRQKQAELAAAAAPHEMHKCGVPINFIPYVSCPKCNNLLSLSNAKIMGKYIYEGHLSCECGKYTAIIEDGIILTSGEKQLSNTWNSQDELLSAELMHFMGKSYNWLYNIFINNSVDAKVCISMGSSPDFLMQYITKLNKDSIYIISDSSPEIIRNTKRHLESINQDFNIVYIVSSACELPIKSNSVDLFIDDFSSHNFLFDSDCYLIDKFGPLLKKDATFIGVYLYYEKEAKTLKKIKSIYPNAAVEKMNINSFIHNLSNHKIHIIDQKNIGSTTAVGESFFYHAEGEKVYFYTYYGKSSTLVQSSTAS